MTHPRRSSHPDMTATELAQLKAEVATELPFSTVEFLGVPKDCAKRVCRRHRRCCFYLEDGQPRCFMHLDSKSRKVVDTVLAEARRQHEESGMSFQLEMALHGGNNTRIAAAEVVCLAYPPGHWQHVFAARARRAARKDCEAAAKA